MVDRLNEVQHFLVQAEEKYFDPESFRINLNACIQASRNVTFAIQSQKRDIPNFELWYPPWRQQLADEPLLRWLVRARNQIVKQSDLELRSMLRVGLILSYYDVPQRDYELPLHLSTNDILQRVRLPDMPEGVKKDAFVRIERRWISMDLPSHELLSILKYAISALASLIDDLARFLTTGESHPSDCPSPPAKDDLFNPRVLTVKVRDGSIVGGLSERPIKDVSREEVEKRYGSPPALRQENGSDLTLREAALRYMEYAVRVFKADGYHASIVTLISKDKGAKIIGLNIRDNAEKYLVWRSLAKDVKEFGATSLIGVSEVWLAAFDEKTPYRRAVDAPNKEEGLHIIAASKDGTQISLLRKVLRKGTEIEFGEIVDQSDGAIYLLEPIREVWGLPKYDEPVTKSSK